MKLDGMKCPHCGSNNTYALRYERAGIWDDETYKALGKEFGENRLLSGSTDNMIYECKCDDCEKHFAAMAILEVKVKKMISRKTMGEVMGLHVKEAEDETDGSKN